MIATMQHNPADVAQSIIGRDYISWSAISTFQQCPLRFFFRYVERLPEPTVAASLVFGGAIHASLEHHFRELLDGNPPPDIGTLLDAYDDACQARDDAKIVFGKDESHVSFHQLAERMLRTFQASEAAQPGGNIIGIEEEFRGELVPGLPDLLARVDLLVDTGAKLVITDFKTSRSRWNQDHVEDSAEQLILYANLVQELSPDKDVGLRFVVVTKTKEPVVEQHSLDLDPQRAERTKHVVERVWSAIETGNYYPAPSPMSCGGCPFREPCRRWCG
ncbi:MAG: PD-(D/E)XK nuclease family protein [Planctomycetota bacterium]|nr:PD-(D/E)XK nuclease family protein [Planctomycetota bacterium]